MKLTTTKKWQKYGIDMKPIFEAEQLKVGTKFIGNINGCMCQIAKLETPNKYTTLEWKGQPDFKIKYNSLTAIIKDLNTGKIFSYGYEALRRCNITIIK